MILVTGTKRSGTSMWMQVLQAAGFTVIGSAFPSHWERSIREANPHGFYESPLRRGVYFATNPDPKSGAFLPPGPTKEHAVKVFIPGVVRSDLAFVHRVLATMRDWRSYGPSLYRLYAMEDDFMAARPLKEGETAESRAERLQTMQTRRGTLPPAIEWWVENYELVRDVTTRKYAFHLLTYERLLADPGKEIEKALKWVGRGDLEKAVAAVEPRSARPPAPEHGGIDPETAAFFDEFYRSIHTTGKLSRAMVDQMNTVHHRIVEQYKGVRRDPDGEPGD